MNAVVIDASVAIAWLLSEPRPRWVDGLLADARRQPVRLTLPSHFWLEAGNALVHARALTDDQVIDGLLRLDAFDIETIEVDRPTRLRALQLAREKGLTVYDAAYLALAHALGVPLATLDRRLDAVAASLGLSFARGGRRVSEAVADYRGDADPLSIAAIGARLAGLRKRYAVT